MERMDELHLVAKALLEYETLSGDEVKTLIEGGKIDRTSDTPSSESPGSSGRPGRRSTIPTTGGKIGGIDPAPQPGGAD
jgi:cell division protease FtsH